MQFDAGMNLLQKMRGGIMESITGVLLGVLLLAVLILLTVVLSEVKKSRRLAAMSKGPAADTVTKDELSLVAKSLADNVSRQIALLGQTVNNQTGSSRRQMEALRGAVSEEMYRVRQENAQHLGEIRTTVDEKLETTLEKRLGESFSRVGERLEQVHQGLGEMQNLAGNVGDLQRLLRNVKIRGTWGEVQLGAILSQMLAPNQFAANLKPNPNSSDIVEYAVKIPREGAEDLWLPIDSKFPLEDYQRLLDAEANGDGAEAVKARAALAARVRTEAKTIKEKYVCPPYTTDFAVLFLPLEGLFAEVLQQQQLCDSLQREYKVIIAGPTTLSALLNILQLGYQSLAIQTRTAEVWELLGTVKNEFQLFEAALAKSQKKLQEVTNSLEAANRRTRVMQRKLKNIESGEDLFDDVDEHNPLTGIEEELSL